MISSVRLTVVVESSSWKAQHTWLKSCSDCWCKTLFTHAHWILVLELQTIGLNFSWYEFGRRTCCVSKQTYESSMLDLSHPILAIFLFFVHNSVYLWCYTTLCYATLWLRKKQKKSKVQLLLSLLGKAESYREVCILSSLGNIMEFEEGSHVEKDETSPACLAKVLEFLYCCVSYFESAQAFELIIFYSVVIAVHIDVAMQRLLQSL